MSFFGAMLFVINGDIPSVVDAMFETDSGFTTTGYASTDFNKWPEFSKIILVMLMFSGACAGSTGGGMKVSRLVIMLKTVKTCHYAKVPNAVIDQSIYMERNEIKEK